MRVLAVDWSGRRTGAERHIYLGEARDGVLLRLEHGRTREEVAQHLIRLAHDHPDVVVGFDFSFSLPEWFLDRNGYPDADALWAAAARDGERWLRECPWPFWGRPGRKRPDDVPEQFRHTERELRPVGGVSPKSTFQIGGAGAVGAGSVRGFPILATLRAGGFSIWPFHRPSTPPVAVEVYPRLLTGAVVKSDAAARAAYLDARLPDLPEPLREVAASGEDAFDAAVSAVVMSRHTAELRALPPVADTRCRREGMVWTPLSS